MGVKTPGVEQNHHQTQVSSGASLKTIEHPQSPQNITSKPRPCKQNISSCQEVVQEKNL
jgi:hypothetical protein